MILERAAFSLYSITRNARMKSVRHGVFALGFLFLVACARARAQVESGQGPFRPYTMCHLPNGLSVVETAPLAPGVTERTVMTTGGPRSVRMLEGRRVMFAYPDEDFYANVKVELLPVQGYDDARAALIGDFDHTLASGGVERNYALKPQMNGFDIRGLDRTKREGGVLGIYLLFDTPSRTVMTIYLLNQEPPKRFKTIEEYRSLRDEFLQSSTSCIRTSLRTIH